MATWAVSDAINSLRSLLGDTATDKYTFKSKCFPPADGVMTRFFVGDTRLVATSLDLFVAGVLVNPTGFVADYAKGTVDVSGGVTPGANADVSASYYNQWFTDDEIQQFLTLGANSIAIDTIDGDFPTFARPAVLSFSAYYAYMFKAAEYASGLQGSAEGFSIDKSRPSPNWKALADESWKMGQLSLAQAKSNPLASKVPTMKFIAFQLPIYQPLGFR